MLEIKIVIPSHKRADRVLTLKAVNNAIVCIPKGQEPEYRRCNPKAEIVTHPDNVIGIAAKRDWIYRKFGNVMMVDDDVSALRRMYVPPNSLVESKIDPATAYEIIQATGNTAHELGAYLFGFATISDGRNYNPMRPFKLSGYINAVTMGLLKGSKIFFDPEALLCEDYFASLINAYHHRYMFMDSRYGAQSEKPFKNRGGISEFRNVGGEKMCYDLLVKKFGDAIKHRKDSPHGKASNPHQKAPIFRIKRAIFAEANRQKRENIEHFLPPFHFSCLNAPIRLGV